MTVVSKASPYNTSDLLVYTSGLQGAVKEISGEVCKKIALCELKNLLLLKLPNSPPVDRLIISSSQKKSLKCTLYKPESKQTLSQHRSE